MEYPLLSLMVISPSHEPPQSKEVLWVMGREEGV